MTWMEGDVLFMFSMTTKDYYALSDDEKLWKNAYGRALPKTYNVLLYDHPYWKFADKGSRYYLYLALTLQQTQHQHQPQTKPHRKISIKSLSEKRTDRHSPKGSPRTSIDGNSPKGSPRTSIDGNSSSSSSNSGSSSGSSSPVLLREKISEIELAMRIGTTNTPLTGLQKAVTCIVMRLAWSPKISREEISENKVRLSDAGALSHLLNLLKIHTDDVLVSCILGALTNLANNKHNTDMLTKFDGVRIIVNSMKKSSAFSVVDFGSSALANVLRYNTQSLHLITEEALPLAFGILTSIDATTQQKVAPLDLLNVLTLHDDKIREKYGKQVLEIIRPLVLSSSSTDEFVACACKAILCFCSEASNRKLAEEMEFPEMIYRVLDKATEPSLTYKAILALYNIYWEEKVSMETFQKFCRLLIAKFLKYDEQELRIGIAIILAKYASLDADKKEFIRSLNHNQEIITALKTLVNEETPEVQKILALFK